ncbi:hypothetical protein CBR_g28725 [Chara braunii]|uniref:Uncharacterized protein n=1 Tax=Chara braunii TaxID=69332 RepID=A0A388L9V9_CHABU|nr:hypothetical protein CBR_g28725 [Chara braunii]|eukprot:GBG79012.1 hypothetical protein CBR_g28725 [Chara braunii]
MRRIEEMEPSPAVRARQMMAAEGIRSSASSGSQSSSRRSARSSSGSSRVADEEWELLQQSSAGVRMVNQWGSANRSRSDWPPVNARDIKAEARSIRMSSGRGISSQGVRVLDDEGPLAGLDGFYIGELFVTEKTIGYGSHGTVVHEGYVRDGTPVAEAKKKQMEEEMERWKEQEEKMAAIEAEVEEEVEVKEELLLERRRGEASTSQAAQDEVEKAIDEWVAHVELGEDREVELIITSEEREVGDREGPLDEKAYRARKTVGVEIAPKPRESDVWKRQKGQKGT